MFTVSVGDRNGEAAKKICDFAEVESVTPDPKTHSLDVRLKDGLEDGGFLPNASSKPAIAKRPSRKGSEYRRRVHADYEGDNQLVGRQESGVRYDSLAHLAYEMGEFVRVRHFS